MKLESDFLGRKILEKLAKFALANISECKTWGTSWAVDPCPLLLHTAMCNLLDKHSRVCVSEVGCFFQFTPSAEGLFQSPVTNFSYWLKSILGATWAYELLVETALLLFCCLSKVSSLHFVLPVEGMLALLWGTYSVFLPRNCPLHLLLSSRMNFTHSGEKNVRAEWQELVSWPEVKRKMSSVMIPSSPQL